MNYFLLIALLLAQTSIFAQENLRFRATIDAAKGFGKKIDGNPQTVGNGVTTITAGVVLRGISLSVGSGIFKMDGTKNNDHYIPVFGELSYLVEREEIAPFFGVRIGKMFPQKEVNNPYPALNKQTMMYNPSIGVAIDLGPLYLLPYLQYFVPADFDSRYDTFGVGIRVMTR